MPRRPGLARQPRLVYTRGFVDLDYRDHPGNTRGGGRVFFQIGTGRDQDPSREFSYRRTDLEILQVFPIFDKKRNFAVRFAAAHVDPLNPDGRVPFFLSPTIGGSHTIRSYLDLRFRDATYVVTNAEYRWEAFSGLDMVLFWDGGDVGTRLQDIRAKEYKTGWGIGLRFNTDRRVFLRIDLGLGGPEGIALLLEVQQRLLTQPMPRLRHRHRLAAARPAARARRSPRRGAGAQLPAYFPDDPIAIDPETQDASKVASLVHQRSVRLHREHVLQARGSHPAAGGERQHHRRGAGLELVHQSRRCAPAHRRRGAPRPRRHRAARPRAAGPSSRARATG